MKYNNARQIRTIKRNHKRKEAKSYVVVAKNDKGHVDSFGFSKNKDKKLFIREAKKGGWKVKSKSRRSPVHRKRKSVSDFSSITIN